ncbi:hypothetical protein DE146DRAFT_66838 [Phaeosphaeria sp. MPI-PUGE-AT-0046c]|nr:hypothetical protein DE146DRAFT_66838 [Phaeosphaeria sp. MPI-PUGE-AT-0046c]
MATQAGSPSTTGAQGPPFAPMVWTSGGPPVKRIDVPAQSVFLVLFLIGAVVHMKIFQGNRARGHKFLANLFIFLFCMSRVLTSIIRIASVSLPHKVQLALAAQVLVAAGVLILLITNIVFAMRLVRATHRSFGWHPAFGIAFKALFTIIGATLIILVTATIQSSYITNAQTKNNDRSMQLFGSTVLALVATLPLPMVALTLLIPYSPLDEFGTGRTRTKVIVLLISTTLLSIGAWYRCGVAWQPPVPRTQPLPGYLAKGPFYIFNFLFEFQTVMMYAILRVDQRWHIPNGAKGPGSYSKPLRHSDLELQDSRPTSADDAASMDSSKTKIDEFDEKDGRSEVRIQIRRVEDIPIPPLPQPAEVSPNSFRLSRPNSSHLSIPTSYRPISRRTSLLQQILTRQPTSEQKREWRASEESRIVRRLGGPWQQLPSPTESAFSYNRTQAPSPTQSTFSSETGATVGTGLSIVMPPSIRDTLHEDQHWTPELDFDMTSPRRFQSLSRKSMVVLKR